MRTETQTFNCNESPIDELIAVNVGDSIKVCVHSDEDYVRITKGQAREFARQLL
jgi:hypothetical protein